MSSVSSDGISVSRNTMRLLNVSTLTLEEFLSPHTPSYVVASHRWSENEKNSSSAIRKLLSGPAENLNATARQFREWLKRPIQKSDDFSPVNSVLYKLRGFCDAIRRCRADVGYLWIDSICIKREDKRELDAAINSMFQWYRNAEACYAYLWDSKTLNDMDKSDWFTRGWTLQELVAPDVVVFFSHQWELLGHKCPGKRMEHGHDTYGKNLNSRVSVIARINSEVLEDFDNIRRLTVADVLSWMRGRQTERQEDMYYSLIGIFGVSIPLNYGEGAHGAWTRLWLALYHQAVSPTAGRDRWQEIASLMVNNTGSSDNSTALLHKVPVQVTWEQPDGSSNSQRRIKRFEQSQLDQLASQIQGLRNTQQSASQSSSATANTVTSGQYSANNARSVVHSENAGSSMPAQRNHGASAFPISPASHGPNLTARNPDSAKSPFNLSLKSRKYPSKRTVRRSHSTYRKPTDEDEDDSDEDEDGDEEGEEQADSQDESE